MPHISRLLDEAEEQLMLAESGVYDITVALPLAYMYIQKYCSIEDPRLQDIKRVKSLMKRIKQLMQ